MVVRIHRTLKAALCACGGANAWKDHLPLIWECVLPPGRILVCLLWRRPYNSSWWCLVSCRHPVSCQLAWWSLRCCQWSYRPLGAFRPRRQLLTCGRGQLGLHGERWSSLAHCRQVQRPPRGVAARQQGAEGPGLGESGDPQKGPPEAAPGQCGPQGRCAAQAWEAEDGLSCFSGFSSFGREASGACEFYRNKSMRLFV